MFLRAIDKLFQLVYRFLCWLIVNPKPEAKSKEKIGHDWQDDKGKWHRVIYVTDKDQPLP
jgi:hypothetical protein